MMKTMTQSPPDAQPSASSADAPVDRTSGGAVSMEETEMVAIWTGDDMCVADRLALWVSDIEWAESIANDALIDAELQLEADWLELDIEQHWN